MNVLFLTAVVFASTTTTGVYSQETGAPSSVPTSINVVVTGAPSTAPSDPLFEVVDESDEPTTVPSMTKVVPPSASPVPVLFTSLAPFTVAPVPTTQSVPVALPPVVTSDLCELNPACAALNLTGQCCPTIDAQFLYCCNGFIEPTCERNDKCAALGLTGACCPTAGNIPSEFDGVFLDCCSSVPDECGTNDTETPECTRRSAVEFREAVNEYNKSSAYSAMLNSGSLAVVTLVVMTTAGLFL